MERGREGRRKGGRKGGREGGREGGKKRGKDEYRHDEHRHLHTTRLSRHTYIISELRILRREHAVGEVERGEVIPSGHILTHILVEELEHEWNTICKHQVLPHILKLVDVVHLEVLQQEQQGGRNGLHDHLLVSVDVQSDLVGLCEAGRVLWWEHVHQDVEGVSVPGPGGRGGGQQHLEQGYHVLGQVGEQAAVQALSGVVSLGQGDLPAIRQRPLMKGAS